MAFAPVSFIIPEYDKALYANWWLKAYEPGTTTPKTMATDSTGVTTASRFELNAQGFPITAGSALVIPYVDGAYDIWLFPTAAEADANDTDNALQFADNLGIDSVLTELLNSTSSIFYRPQPGGYTTDILLDTGDPAVYQTEYYDSGESSDSGSIWVADGTTGAPGEIDLDNNRIRNGNGKGYVFPGDTVKIVQFGADPTGAVAIDSIQDSIIASGINCDYGSGTYKRSTGIAFDQDDALHFGDSHKTCKILFDDGLTSNITGQNITIRGINFSAGDNTVSVHMIQLDKGANNFLMDGCRIGDVSTPTETSTQNGLRIDAQDVADFEIKNTLFENISCMGDEGGEPVQNGFASGVIFFGAEENEAAYTAPSKGSIHDCDFINIFTEKNPSNPGVIDSDADGIRIVISGGIAPDTNVQWGLDIDDCYARGVQKSFVKCGGMTNLNVRRATVVSDRTDIAMTSAVRIQWGSNVTVEDITCVGDFNFLVNLFGQNITVDGINYSPTDTISISSYCVLVQTEDSFENRDITVTNVRATKAAGVINLTDPAGVGSTGTNLSFSNFYVDRLLSSTSTNPVVDIKDCTDLRLEDINIYDNQSQANTCVFVRDCPNLVLDACYFEATGYIINQDENSEEYSNITINNCVGRWTDDGNVTFPLVNLVPTSGTHLINRGLTIDGLKIIARSTTARVENAVKVIAEDFSISNVNIYAPNTIAATSAPFIEAVEILDSNHGSLSNVTYFTDIPTAGAGTSWAVNVANSDAVMVDGVVSDNSGVILRTGTTNTQVGTVNAAVGKTAFDKSAAASNPAALHEINLMTDKT